MQLSEFRDLLANDGFAATFQTMGQYRTELLRALDGLRAKADARPVAWTNAKELEGVKTVSEGYARAIWGAENESFATIPLFTHPEASAPGLSERERYLIDKAAERLREADFIDEASAVRAILTRASAATVAEASDRDENLCQSCVDNRGELFCTAGPQCVAISNSPLKSVPCTACELNGVYSTDGEGPFDCYKCGKKATPQQFETNRDIQQLADWLLVEPTNGERLHFAGPLERDFLGLSRVKMVSASGSIWTLIAGLKEDYKTNSQRLHNIREAAQNSELSDEKRVMQLAAISTAAAGYWKEGDSIHPDYDSTALRDTAKLYEKYDELFKAAQQQAEPGADERAAFEAWLAAHPYPITWHERGAFFAGYRAAQSGQRAGVEEDAKVLPFAVLDALRFYANGSHFCLFDKTAWDTVSGEPQNFWCDEAGTAMVEDGSIAKAVLQGVAFTDGDNSAAVDGEVYTAQEIAAAPTQQQEGGK